MRTQTRAVVLKALRRFTKPQSLATLVGRLRDAGQQLAPATVYQALRRAEGKGEARREIIAGRSVGWVATRQNENSEQKEED